MPVTVNVTAEVPAVAAAGEMVAIAGAGSVAAEIVKGKAFDRTPELDTPTLTVVAEAISEAGTIAVSCVGLTNVVARTAGTAGGGLAIQFTTERFTKFVPETVSVTPEELHDGVVLDEVVEDDNADTTGGMIVNAMDVEAVPPGLLAET